MPRIRSKYGALTPNLSEIITRNFLAYAKSPAGTKYEEGLRAFAATKERVDKYKENVRSYFNALATVLREDPDYFKRALAPIYADIRKRAVAETKTESQK